MIPLLLILASEAPNPIEQEVVSHIARELSIPLDDVEIHSLGISEYPTNCENSNILVSTSPNERYKGHANIRITFIKNGKHCTSISTRAKLTAWVQIPIAAGDFLPGEELTLILGRVPIDRLQGRPAPGLLDENSEKWIAVSPIKARSPVSYHQIKKRPANQTGDIVTLVTGTKHLTITANAELLEDANIGDKVSVICDTTETKLSGILLNKNCVGIIPVNEDTRERCR